jgi:hypothetical protein
MKLSTLWKRFEQFWFGPISPSPLCLFRIFYGILVLGNSLLLMPDLFQWFGHDAMLSQQTVHAYQKFEPRFSLFFMFPETHALIMTLYALLMLSSLSLTLGLFTRFSALLVFVCLLSFHNRGACMFNAGDTILQEQAFLLIFSHAGALYSIDNLLKNKFWNKGHAGPSTDLDRTQNISPQLNPWAQRLLQVQLSAVYVHVFLVKIVCSQWIDGSAVYYCGRLEDMARLPTPLFENFWACQLASWSTLVIEFALFALIWFKRFRYPVIILGALLHLGIDWSMQIPTFEFVMIFGMILFIPPEDIDKFVGYLKGLIRGI